jgi:hypothetical protein
VSSCTAVWSQQGDAAWARRGTIPDVTAQVTLAPDGKNGWAIGQSAVWSTHDGGRTWGHVPTFAYPQTGGVGIITGPAVAWALLPGAAGATLWRTPVGSDTWTRIQLPKVPKTVQMENVLPDSRVVLGNPLGVVRNATQHVVVGDGTTWHRYSVPCYQVPQLLGGEPSTRGGACGLVLLPGRFEGQPLVSSGTAPTGSSVDVGMVTTPDRPVGPVRTLYVAGSRAVVYGPDGRSPAHLDLATHEVVRQFAIIGDQAVLSTSRNRVFRSEDGGYTWTLDD